MNTIYACTTYTEFLTLITNCGFGQIGLNPRKGVGAVCQIRVWTKNTKSKPLSVIVTEEIFAAFAAACQHYLDSKETMCILRPRFVAERIRKLELLIED
jgi:hypothetical protein